ncbi:hypothetical protein D9M68_977810 [compost metagenome]
MREGDQAFVGEVSLCGLAGDAHQPGVFGEFVVEDLLGFGVGEGESEVEECGSQFGGSGSEPGWPRTHVLLPCL